MWEIDGALIHARDMIDLEWESSRTSRYGRLTRLDTLSGVDLEPLQAARVLIVGCGALGSTTASMLVRSGVGSLRIVDRDVVGIHNLVDQILFDEQDAEFGALKAEAAAERLGRLDGRSTIEGVVADFCPDNARKLAATADVIIDGVDNVEGKFLLNDLAVTTCTPLVYGGCAGTDGAVMVVQPGRTHCLRCLWPEPERLVASSCRTHGAFPATIAMTAAVQYAEAIKVLLGLTEELRPGFTRVNGWSGVVASTPLPEFRDDRSCPACARGEFPYLDGSRGTTSTSV